MNKILIAAICLVLTGCQAGQVANPNEPSPQRKSSSKLDLRKVAWDSLAPYVGKRVTVIGYMTASSRGIGLSAETDEEIIRDQVTLRKSSNAAVQWQYRASQLTEMTGILRYEKPNGVPPSTDPRIPSDPHSYGGFYMLLEEVRMIPADAVTIHPVAVAGKAGASKANSK